MVAKAKFSPIGDVLSPEVAFVQASSILDVATELAIIKGDVEGLSTLAALYMEIASRLMVDGEPSMDDDDEEDDSPGFGFSSKPVIVEKEVL